MSTVIQFPDDPTEDQASLWISRLDRGLSASEHAALEAWLDENPAHRDEFLRQARFWDKTESLSRLAHLIPHSSPTIEVARHNRRWLGYGAATVVLALTLALGLATLPTSQHATTQPADVAYYETASGGLSRVTLSHGSILTINTASRVEVRMTEHERQLILETGEINIDVAHDASRPLQVFVRGRIFEALGTQFNIRIDDSQHIELLVTEGKVRIGLAPKAVLHQQPDTGINTGAQDIVIAQGQRAIISESLQQVDSLVSEDIEVQLSWQQGNLIFRGEPLSEAVKEVGRYTSVDFVILDEESRAIQIAGRFKSGDIAGFLASLEANFNIQHQRDGNKTLLLRPRQKHGDQ